jgi:hypothetical protein
MTLKTYVNPGWKKVLVKQGSISAVIQPASDEKGSYVLYQALPNAEDIEISVAK